MKHICQNTVAYSQSVGIDCYAEPCINYTVGMSLSKHILSIRLTHV